MNIETVTVSQEISVTTGQNFNFDKSRLFTSITATLGPDDVYEAVYADLAERAQAVLKANAQRLTTTPSVAAAVAEARQEANTDSLPQVRAPAAKKTVWNEADQAASSDGLTTSDLEVGAFPKKATLTATVQAYYPSNGKGPSGGKTILTDGRTNVEVAHWDEEPEWNQGDQVTVDNAFQVKEYNGKLQLDLGKFVKVAITGNAAPVGVDQWT